MTKNFTGCGPDFGEGSCDLRCHLAEENDIPEDSSR